MEDILYLATPFIALILLSVMIDKLTIVIERIMFLIPKFPDRFEWSFAYIIIVGISYYIASEGDFDILSHLGLTFNYTWQGYLITAIAISGGSCFVRTSFDMINTMPSVLGGMKSHIRNIITPVEPHNDINIIEDIVNKEENIIFEDSNVINKENDIYEYNKSFYSDDI
jgi:hypothetical protein